MTPLTQLAPLALQPTGLPLADFWFREAASENAAAVDNLYYGIYWICVFFFVLIVGLMVAFIARYHARPGHREEHTSHHNNALEAAWSIFPGLLIIPIFGYGFIGYLDLRTPPEGAYEIQVVAQKWQWTFIYPNGAIEPELHVPIDEPVRLVMTSSDVLHSLFIPAFRVKMDVVPGRYSELWFTANKRAPDTADEALRDEDVGGFDLFCTEYCGQQHSSMISKVIVHESGDFQTWLAEAIKIDAATPPSELGKKIYEQRGCKGCHSLDGRAGTGPTFKGIYGEMHDITGQSPVEVDENYIRESVLEPMAKVRAGYKGVMPSFQGQLNEADIAGLVWFIKSLKEGEELPESWNEIGGVPGQEEEGAEDQAAETPAEPAAEAETESETSEEEPAGEEEAADPQT